MGSKQRSEMDEDSSMEQKTCEVHSLGKRNVFRLHLNESREGFCWSGRGRSFQFLLEGEGHSSFCWSGMGRSFWFLLERKGKVILVSVRVEGEGHSGVSERKGKVIPVSVRAEGKVIPVYVRAEGDGHSGFCQSGRGRSFQFLSERKGKVIPCILSLWCF